MPKKPKSYRPTDATDRPKKRVTESRQTTSISWFFIPFAPSIHALPSWWYTDLTPFLLVTLSHFIGHLIAKTFSIKKKTFCYSYTTSLAFHCYVGFLYFFYSYSFHLLQSRLTDFIYLAFFIFIKTNCFNGCSFHSFFWVAFMRPNIPFVSRFVLWYNYFLYVGFFINALAYTFV